MLKRGKTYDEVCKGFRWEVPEMYNIGVDICDKWADDRSKLALIAVDDEGRVAKHTHWQLRNSSNQLANALKAAGIARGDRVAIMLPQCVEAVISHTAIYKMGGIVLPLLTLFGSEALEHRLGNSEAKAIITDPENISKIISIRERLPNLKVIIVKNWESNDGMNDFWTLTDKGSPHFEPVRTKAEDPALLIYTSGTTGTPKGALHAHRVLLGHMPAVEYVHSFFPQEGDIMWSPAEWAWIAGLLTVLLPSMRDGVPVVAYRQKKFNAEETFDFMSKHGIRNTLLPATVLRMLRQVKDPHKRYNYKLRTIVSGGEALGDELRNWGREVMGVDINEIYGQTEVHLALGGCSEILEHKPGAIGKALPGRTVEILDDELNVVPPGIVGQIAVRRPDPIIFLGYWDNPEATSSKMTDE